MRSLLFAALWLAQFTQPVIASPSTELATTKPMGPPPSQIIRLWEHDAPGAQGSDESADVPRMGLYPASQPTGAAIIVCMGGGYGHLAGIEGSPVAAWLNSTGVTAFVLRYRLGPKYRHPVEMGDVQRAIRLVRSRAEEWKLDPKRIGVMG